MNLTIEKKHNEQIVIIEDDKVLSVKNIVIEAKVTGSLEKGREVNTKEEHNLLEIILTYSHFQFPEGLVRTLNNKKDNITLDMEFGGDYKLSTFGLDDELNKRIIFSKNDEILGRVQKFRYELSTEMTYGKAEMELILT